jgi:hypothetical protein
LGAHFDVQQIWDISGKNMTVIAGFIINRKDFNEKTTASDLNLSDYLQQTTFTEYFPRHGIFLYNGNVYPIADSEHKGAKFLDVILELFQELSKAKYNNLQMAVALLNMKFEDYEVIDIGRELSPISIEDWLALDELLWKNQTWPPTASIGSIVVGKIKNDKGKEHTTE